MGSASPLRTSLSDSVESSAEDDRGSRSFDISSMESHQNFKVASATKTTNLTIISTHISISDDLSDHRTKREDAVISAARAREFEGFAELNCQRGPLFGSSEREEFGHFETSLTSRAVVVAKDGISSNRLNLGERLCMKTAR